MIIEEIKVGNRVVGRIQKLSKNPSALWAVYVKGMMGLKPHYAFIGSWSNKRLAIKAVKLWSQL